MADDQDRGVPRGRRREDGEVADHEIVGATRTAGVDDQETETETETEIETETETGIAIEIDATGRGGTVVDGARRSPGGHPAPEESKSPKLASRAAGNNLGV